MLKLLLARPDLFFFLGQCLLGTDGCVSTVWGLEFSPAQVTYWFPEEATEPRCLRLQPLDGKHDPSPLIFSQSGDRKRHSGKKEKKKKEGRKKEEGRGGKRRG